MASILITGGLGYLGGRIASQLVKAGHRVRATSRKAQPAPAWLPEMQVLAPDWESTDELIAACTGHDAVVHLAAMNEIYSGRDPVGALRTNGLASLMLQNAAQSAGVRRFIFFSTAHVYGAPLAGDIDEATLARPRHPYAITHRVAEDFVLAAHDSGQIEGVVVRLSNGFGAPMTADVDRWTLLVNDLCRQALTTGALKLQSAGTQLRDFITLDDVGRAVQHLVELDTSSLGNGLFNLGDRTMSILQMTEMVAARASKLLGCDIPIIRPADNGAPVPSLHYHTEKIRNTGFRLRSDIDQEIDSTLLLCQRAFSRQN
ncbi:NAD-dependent epimerase/dehydratase family protein [Herbaspirillum seropedicae]|uniref:NAD-dependent epimerase/dehydratase family protein n=1 Tax=Herbaspirillum seropedicae TaxID=964 RepID=UPI00286484C0|nr:SDR family oxidoreductase [Herbaspirillum seropedicae]MDR6395958.1 UDP-glucose 4-epimerase [Herbaspirillum seropedicae]